MSICRHGAYEDRPLEEFDEYAVDSPQPPDELTYWRTKAQLLESENVRLRERNYHLEMRLNETSTQETAAPAYQRAPPQDVANWGRAPRCDDEDPGEPGSADEGDC